MFSSQNLTKFQFQNLSSLGLAHVAPKQFLSGISSRSWFCLLLSVLPLQECLLATSSLPHPHSLDYWPNTASANLPFGDETWGCDTLPCTDLSTLRVAWKSFTTFLCQSWVRPRDLHWSKAQFELQPESAILNCALNWCKFLVLSLRWHEYVVHSLNNYFERLCCPMKGGQVSNSNYYKTCKIDYMNQFPSSACNDKISSA